jgi:hypothetical protein
VDKGTRVKVFKGRNAVGTTGVIFWIGENKYGDGKRIGLEGDDGQTYWLPMENVQETSEVAEAENTGPEPKKGSKVRWGSGETEGFGTVFWLGAAKNGRGSRVGVNDAHGETHWLSAKQVTVIDDLPDTPAASSAPDMPEGPSWESAPDYGDDDGDNDDPGPSPVWNDNASEPVWDDEEPPF